MATDASSGEAVEPPVGLMDALHARDPVRIALRALADRSQLGPVGVPSVQLPSDELEAILHARASTVPAELRDEHQAYCAAVEARAGAKAENRRRLRFCLWAEQALRSANRVEWRAVRAHNMEAWGVQEPAPHDFALREKQVARYA